MTAPDIPPIAPATKGTHVFDGRMIPPTLRRSEVLGRGGRVSEMEVMASGPGSSVIDGIITESFELEGMVS
jgi:hypothetical protein